MILNCDQNCIMVKNKFTLRINGKNKSLHYSHDTIVECQHPLILWSQL